MYEILLAEAIYANYPSVTIRVEFSQDHTTGTSPWTVTIDRLNPEYIP